MYSIMCFNLRKTAAGLDHTYHKKEDQQGKANRLQSSVDVGDNAPDSAALKFRGGLGDDLPDFRQLIIPGLQGIVKIFNHPVSASQIKSPHFYGKARASSAGSPFFDITGMVHSC